VQIAWKKAYKLGIANKYKKRAKISQKHPQKLPNFKLQTVLKISVSQLNMATWTPTITLFGFMEWECGLPLACWSENWLEPASSPFHTLLLIQNSGPDLY
jgi:hypothetical protein